ncbi:ankyrin repeat domain-containing protein SOWAHB isoform X1 [Spodoptera litura]|uniref:Ankyrin repeat domain-containing protein SOWAHB isoform X1 n=1 Tax=Spodoptera litura TaxID=69820 RepID=A0A9J7J1A7_SPOLT|nr:ankyrin repeat domain-containing protein SOWAHB isoform X1 [Spodoptera litura]
MSPPSELSFEEILKFMLLHNGRVTNHELVKHFKVFLMNPDMRDEARSTFKKHVNSLAIIKNQNNEKWLILKKKYMPTNGKDNGEVTEKPADTTSTSVTETPTESETPEVEEPPERPPLPLQLNQDFNIITSLIQDNMQNLNNAEVISDSQSQESLTSIPSEDIPPKVHPRRRSSEKSIEKRSNVQGMQGHRSSIPNQDTSRPESDASPTLSSSRSESMLVDSEQTISVKERKQMFNRMASESDVLKTNKLGGNLSSQGLDEEDRVSLDQKSEADPLDSKQKQWILCAARGDYHALAKMCKENAKLVKTKDPFTGYTAMHWACKRGDENLVKLLGGVTRQVVNERSNGGYTPLHIAMQFRHENVYRLLVEVYDADPNVRDWSGRKPRQYLVHMDTSLSPGSYRKPDTYDLRRTVTSPPVIRVPPNAINAQSKKEGFLRIGSLNVRVKKTTEAFSNFLGVGATRSSAYVPKSAREERRSDDSDQLKSWGSADNIQKDDKLMPPPNNNKVRRRGASGRRGIGAAHSRSTPSTPDQPRAQIGVSEEGDSDSDSAAGFHAAWRQQRASNCT